jgi:hypothetical protein
VSSPCAFTHVLIDEAGQVNECGHCSKCVPAAAIGMGSGQPQELLAVHPAQMGPAPPPTAPACLPACMHACMQALLPEALIPLALLAPPPAFIGAPAASWGAVLCGDPRQLGPVVRSQVGGCSSSSCTRQ